MNIINRSTVKQFMLDDLENLLICVNEDVRTYCDQRGWDIYDFIEELDGKRIE